MKKITLLTAVLFVTLLSNAQITKGSTMIGGSISGSSSEKKDDQNAEDKGSSFSFGLELGHFIADNKAVGLFFNYSQMMNKYTYVGSPVNGKYESQGFYTGIFYRQYFPISAKWYLFGEAAAGYNKYNSEIKSNDKLTSKEKGWRSTVSITPGISFAAGKRLFVESSFKNLLAVNYNTYKTTDYNSTGSVTNTSKSKSYSANANLSGINNIQIGLRWILPGKKK